MNLFHRKASVLYRKIIKILKESDVSSLALSFVSLTANNSSCHIIGNMGIIEVSQSIRS
jgi:hypothetical protein